MRLAALQLAARFGHVDAALAATRTLVRRAPADLVLLPEASLTGYVSPRGNFDLTNLAQSLDGPIARACSELARDSDIAVGAPLIERAATGELYNAYIVFDRAGRRVAHYRKRHPWYPEEWATAGENAHPVFELDGVSIAIAICFDLHFLEAEAAASLEAADLLLFPSAWVHEEPEFRPAALRDLARRHRIAVANANWAAGDVVVAGQGSSLIIDRTGETLAVAGEREDRIDALLTPHR